MRKLALFLAACVVVAAGVHLYETHEQDRLLILSQGDPRVLAELLLAREAHSTPQCRLAWGPDDLDILVESITIVERFSTPTLERLAESAAIRAAVLIGLPVPDLSIGDAQIRVSAALKSLQEISPPRPSHLDRNGLALRLLDPCENRRLAASVLIWIAKRSGLGTDALDRTDILGIAAAYNGQAPPHRVADLVAKQTYTRLVYHLHHAVRFALLRKNLASEAQATSRNHFVAHRPQ
jgi:hypothetical protein